jgi:mono/diheme cytochrome c family protein
MECSFVRAVISIVLALVCFAACGKPDQDASTSRSQAGGGAVSQGDPRAALFVAKGCPQCHSISALGVKSSAEVGPDLTEAYEDVQLRFGVQLDQFLANPTGTMQVVLTSQITLTPAERDSIVSVLEALWREHERAGQTH